MCGIFMEGPAAEKLLWWFHREQEGAEGGRRIALNCTACQDSPDDGYLDIAQFIFLFNQVADMMAKEA